MSKLHTTAALLASGSFAQLRSRFWTNFCGWRLRRSGRRSFMYRLAGIPIVCIPGIHESEEACLTGEVDHLELALLKQWFESGDNFVNVGANLGIYTFMSTSLFSSSGGPAVSQAGVPVFYRPLNPNQSSPHDH